MNKAKVAAILQYAEKFFKLATEGWNYVGDLSEMEELSSIYSDVYKEKYGIRPRWMNFKDMSVEELKAELERLEAEPSMTDSEPPPPSEGPVMEGTVSPSEVDEFETQPTHSGMGKRR